MQQITSVNFGEWRAGAAKLTLNVQYLIIVERPKYVVGNILTYSISIHKVVLMVNRKYNTA
jgi:hypothetical protein